MSEYSLPTDADIEAAAKEVNGTDHWIYGAQWMRSQMRGEIERLRAIEHRAKQVMESLHGWSAEEAGTYIVTGVVQ